MITNFPKEFSSITPSFLKGQAFTKDELLKIKKYTNDLDLSSGKVFLDSEKDDSYEARKSDICFFKRDEHNFWIFDRINQIVDFHNQKYYNMNLYGYEAIQYGQYKVDDYYDFHIDLILNHKSFDEAATRKLSISVLLNDNFVGGDFEFQFGPKNEKVDLKAGDFVIFPSFLSHRVSKVTQGCRESLVIWVVGPKFK